MGAPARAAALAMLVALVVLLPAAALAAGGRSPAPLPVGRPGSPLSLAVRPATGGGPYVTGATTLATIAVKSQPTTPTFDPSDDDLYVQNFGAPLLGGNSESIVNDQTNAVVATVNVGDDPLSSVYANATGDVYVMNFGLSNNVTVFHGTSIIKWIPTGVTPIGGVYDPADQYVYVVDQSSNNLTVLSGTSTVGSVPVGAYPGTAVYDPKNGFVYVPNSGSNNVTIVNGTASAGLSVVASVSAGSGADDAVYDPDNGFVYVPNAGAGSVTVINNTTVVRTVTVGVAPTMAGFDGANGWVYVADPGSNSVDILNGTSVVGNVSLGVDPRSVTFDPADGLVYVPDWTTDDLSILNGSRVVATVALGTNPYGAIYDPHDASVIVSNFNSNNLSRLGTPSPSERVTFNETGLPPGTAWSVDWNATDYPTTAATVGFPSGAGAFNYTLGSIASYSANPASGRTTVGSSAVTVNVTFQPAYPVSFNETGLANGTFWFATIGTVTNGSGSTSFQLWEPNGTYSYTITPLPGYSTTWSGTVHVAGAKTTVDVSFGVPTYEVWFNETGLAAGTLWGANLSPYQGTSTNASFAIDAVNGSYVYGLDSVPGYLGTPSSGRVSVTGATVNVRISFVAAYGVDFEESGLPAGTNWTVTLGSGPISTTLANQSVVRPNGSYSYSLSTSDFNYIPVDARGSFNVTGTATAVPVAFETRRTATSSFWINFTETGLPSGTTWSVTLGTTTNASSSTTLGFLVGNATYAFNTSAPGFLATPGHGLVVANGPAIGATPIVIAFAPAPSLKVETFAIGFSAEGLASGESWTVAIGAASASGAGHPLVLDEPNGTYTYSVLPVGGYVTNGSGTVAVSGAATSVYVLFRPFETFLEFREVGLPSGATWNVTIGSTWRATDVADENVFSEPNGTYDYSFSSVAGYATPPSGTVVVNGTGPTIVEVTYTPEAAASAPAVFGLPVAEALGLAGAIALVLVVLAAVVSYRRPPPPATGEVPELAPSEEPALGPADEPYALPPADAEPDEE